MLTFQLSLPCIIGHLPQKQPECLLKPFLLSFKVVSKINMKQMPILLQHNVIPCLSPIPNTCDSTQYPAQNIQSCLQLHSSPGGVSACAAIWCQSLITHTATRGPAPATSKVLLLKAPQYPLCSSGCSRWCCFKTISSMPSSSALTQR